jgi:Protein of unknown function (DUF3015)/Curli production assembly/transport component CsgG
MQLRCRAWWVRAALAALLVPALGAAAAGQAARAATMPAAGTETVAVMQFEAIGASKAEVTAAGDRLQESLLATGKFTVVDRQQIDNILKEQALQQTGCTSTECAVQVGKILGVRRLILGRINGFDATHWFVSATMVDVETAQTLRTTSVRYEGTFFDLLGNGIPVLAARIAGVPEPRGLAGSAAVAAAPNAQATRPSTAQTDQASNTPLQQCYKEVGSKYRGLYIVGYILSVTPGLTTLTSVMRDRSDCEHKYKLSQAEIDQMFFISDTMPDLLRDMAKGNGDYLRSLADLMGCAPAQHEAFARMAQERFEVLSATAETSGADLLVALRREMARRPALAGCVRT